MSSVSSCTVGSKTCVTVKKKTPSTAASKMQSSSSAASSRQASQTSLTVQQQQQQQQQQQPKSQTGANNGLVVVNAMATSSSSSSRGNAAAAAAAAAMKAKSANVSRSSSAISLTESQVSIGAASSTATSVGIGSCSGGGGSSLRQPTSARLVKTPMIINKMKTPTPASATNRPPVLLKKSSSSLSSSSTATSGNSRLKSTSGAGGSSSSHSGSQQLSFSGIRRPTSSPSGASGANRQATSTKTTKTTTTTTTTTATAKVPTLAMSQREKDQQIRLLIKERDEHKFQAELMAKKSEEWREKFEASELERSHVTSEADDEVIELRRLAQEFEDENKRLAERLVQREMIISDTQFKLDELECDRQELRRELDEKVALVDELESDKRDLLAGSRTGSELITERQISKAKYEREIEELKERLQQKEECMMQLRSSLEMRKMEAQNLQTLATDLERKLKIETERSERHLKRIDEINLSLKSAEDKLATKVEENEMQEKQVKQLRQEVRSVEDKLEQLSLARKKDVDILHCKLSAARSNACRSTTPTGGMGAPSTPSSPANNMGVYKTPTPQDEIVRLQMEIRDLKDQLIDREAELDCNRRDLEVIKRKMETRTLEVDCNNQELARRCQDLLEQNRQSEETVKQLLKSTTEHSAQLMRATEDLKEANAKCIKLREEVNELEAKLDDEMKRGAGLLRENNLLKEENQLQLDQIDRLRQQTDTLNEQLTDLCEQLDVQSHNLHKDREMLADQLSEHEINSAQLRHDLATAKQDLRTSKLQTHEVISERDRMRSDLDMKEKYIRSRNDIIEQLRHELEDSQKSLSDYKTKLESLRNELDDQLDVRSKDLHDRYEQVRSELQAKSDECLELKRRCQDLEIKLEESNEEQEQIEDEKFDEMRRKHSEELDQLKAKLAELERQIEETAESLSCEEDNGSRRLEQEQESNQKPAINSTNGSMNNLSGQKKQEYETQIEFLNSLVVDMQRKADDYKNRLATLETIQLMNDFVKAGDNNGMTTEQVTTNELIPQNATSVMTYSTLKRNNFESTTTTTTAPSSGTMKRHVRIQDPVDGQISSLTRAKRCEGGEKELEMEDKKQTIISDSLVAELEQQFKNGTLTRQKVPMRHISGRPFCDICQVYDLHHTVYCPKVSEKLQQSRNKNNSTNTLDGSNLTLTLSDSMNNNNNDNNNYINATNHHHQRYSHNNTKNNNIDFEMFKEYEQSLETNTHRPFYPQFASLRRLPPPPPPPPSATIASHGFHRSQAN